MARPTRKMMIVAAAVVALAAIGGGATYLATTPTGSSQATSADAGGKVDKPGKAEKAKARKAMRAGRGGDGGMLGKVEHGEFTTASAGVMQVQRGAITAIDAGSVTVRSLDGFTASYVITPTTTLGKSGKSRKATASGVAPAPGTAPTPTAVSQLKAGDTVQVMATKTDTGSSATRIAPTRA